MRICDNGVYRDATEEEIELFSTEENSTMVHTFRIQSLKNNLSASDYKAIKYAEGLISEEDYAETRAQRQAWRAEINQLESER